MQTTLQPARDELVLVVDDNPKNLQVVSKVIAHAGYRVAAATDFQRTLRMVIDTPPDLILLDIVMPGMDGLQLCRRLKETPEAMEIPIIMLTVQAGADNIVEGFNAGAADYVTKPFNPEELLARVNTQIELKRIHDQQKKLILQLQQALSEVKQLSALIPICCHCKKVRADKGYWLQVEEYIATHSSARIRYSTCPDCRQQKMIKT